MRLIARCSVTWSLVVLLLVPLVALAQGGSAPALVWEATLYGEGERALRWPVAVASAAGDELVVADGFNPRLILFRWVDGGWRAEKSLALPGHPVDLVVAGDGYLVSLRGPNQLMVAERPALALRPRVLPKGVVPGALAARANGAALVLDEAATAVLHLSAAGGLERSTPVPECVRAVAADPGGSGFYAACPEQGQVLKILERGEIAETWSVPPQEPVPAWPAAIAVDRRGRLLMTDRHAGRIVLFDAAGRSQGIGSRKGWRDGLLLFPADIEVLPDGRIAVADLGNGRVQVFRPAEP